ncbi:MAG TPA: hypothetical protein VEX86_18160, partial [Longimicrobium sp.]|nr:hypothetical protein [Longimicrobium sp.]
MSASSDEPQEPSGQPGDVPLDALREFMREQVEERSLREVAGEVGIGKDAVRSFAEGDARPYSQTVQKVREWYVREVHAAHREHGQPPVRPYAPLGT